MKNDKKERERPEAYPKPTQTDLQLKDQPEFMEPEANRSSADEPVHDKRQESSKESSRTEEQGSR